MKIPNGYQSAFFRVYDSQTNSEITQMFEKLTYVYDEENDEEIILVMKSLDRNIPDSPYFQPKRELTIIWGFIKGKTTRRKVYIENPEWKYSGQDTITGTLYCSEKATSLKGASDNTIYKGKSLPQIVQDKANKHGLKASIVLDDNNANLKIVPLPGETLNEYIYRENSAKVAAQQQEYKRNPTKLKMDMDRFIKEAAEAESDPIVKKERELREKYSRDWSDGAPINVEQSVQRDLAIYKASLSFKIYKNEPQANKSDKQFLNGLAKRENNGPYLVETRDDEIILRRRDFKSAPVYQYTYGSPDGELLDFNPETKRKSRKGSSTGMGFSGWNAMEKTFFSGTATGADGDPSLAKAMEMLKYYKGIQSRGGGSLITGQRAGRQFLPFIDAYNVASKIDNAGVYTRRVALADVTVDNQVTALTKAIDDFKQAKDDRRKEMYNALGINPPDAYNQANNLRRNSELNKNPASARVWGNPMLETGQIITITGVAKKYSGNYYLKRVSHEIDQGSGYFVDMEMVRQGDNIKVNEDYVSSSEMGRQVNTQLPPKSANGDKTISVPIKGNPRVAAPGELMRIVNSGQ